MRVGPNTVSSFTGSGHTEEVISLAFSVKALAAPFTTTGRLPARSAPIDLQRHPSQPLALVPLVQQLAVEFKG
jgi:hypothetical protein